MKISPSILAADFANLKSEVQRVEKCGVDMLHLDVMDGLFVPNISFGVPVIKSLRPHSKLIFDVHLMIQNPLNYIEDFVNAGADIITFHAESFSDTFKTIEKIKNLGKKVGISIKPKTDVQKILPLLKLVDLCLIMTVEPGFGGQKFIEKPLQKIEIIKKVNPDIQISVDGGINLETLKILKNYPIDIIVVGTCIFGAKDIQKTILELKQ